MTSAGDRLRLEGQLRIVRAIMSRDGTTVEEALTLAGVVIPEEDHEAIIQLWYEQSSTTIEILAPAELSELGGPRPWFRDCDPSDGYYWKRQQAFLTHDLNRKDYEIDSLDLSSNQVLSYLEDPNHPDPFNVRGLVVGYVQSGKTANFSALIAKAVDAGYKIVIVLSGLHNTLRQQTQRRLQRDLGHEDTPGVGPPEPSHVWVWMTGDQLDGDFNPAGQNAGVLQGNNQVILVVKKNKSRLDRLISWMQNKVPAHVPVLIIDDEADQASINTRGNRAPYPLLDEDLDPADQTDLTPDDIDGEFTADELDPSAINLRIRHLLRQFARVGYVAYTATPFANVLIDPDALDREAGDDLFPRDFIISLPKPPGSAYVGTDRLFGRDQLPGDSEDVTGLDVIEIVPDHEIAMLAPPRRTGDQATITPSLIQALKDYLLSSGARLYRAGEDKPCTMLVHTDMRRAVQNSLAGEIVAELASIRQAWKYDDTRQLRIELEERWNSEFRPKSAALDIVHDVPFEAVEPLIDRLIDDQVPVRCLNSDHPDNLDFDAEPNLKAVLVGGNKLSRGVTIEGLLVSFYVRASLVYDTLLQMGRWFGYRGDYVDLTRLYSTQLLVSCFHDLATAEEDLRRQIELYDRRKVKPLQLAPKIMSHPVMLVTAQNKMRDARVESQSYDGELVQTLRFPFGSPDLLERLEENLECTRRFLSALGPPNAVADARPAWADVLTENILAFLDEFWVLTQTAIHPPTVRSYIHAQQQYNELTNWRVLVGCATRARAELGTESLAIEGFDPVALINRSRLKKDPTSLGVITEPSDETLGLTEAEVNEAIEQHAAGEYPTRGRAYRDKRSPQEGLLILYPISGNSEGGRNAKNRRALFDDGEARRTLIGYALSFPSSNSNATVEYVQGPESRRQ